MTSSTPASSAGSQEVAPLGERMGHLQLVRAGLVAVVLAAATFMADVVGAAVSDLMLASAAFLLLTATVEALRRMGGRRGLLAVGGMLLMDGAYLAWVMYQTGGTQSPLRFLVYIHVIAVTLLASYRTGLKIALWHSLLYFSVFYAQVARIVPAVEPQAAAGRLQESSVFNIIALWLVALVTTLFSSVNERELRRRKRDLEALAEMAEHLENATEPRDVAGIVLDALSETFGFTRGVLLANPRGEDLIPLAFRGPGEAPEVSPSLDGSVRQAWEQREALLLKKLSLTTDPQLSRLLPFATGVVLIPLFDESRPVGALAVEYPGRGTRIARPVVEMATQFASHAALALSNAWLLQQVRKMADTDGLTGIPNRRTFEQTLARELSRAERNGEQVTLVMLDVDQFKNLNDKYGHQTGDEVLKAVAAALTHNCRGFDTPARYGGEEFAVILPACSVAESLIAAERLRKGINQADLPVPTTASAGVATYPMHAGDPDALIRAADEALYESKRGGRNRVTRSRRDRARATEQRPRGSSIDFPSKDIGR
jgi:two-component system, cell cycle response regulator